MLGECCSVPPGYRDVGERIVKYGYPGFAINKLPLDQRIQMWSTLSYSSIWDRGDGRLATNIGQDTIDIETGAITSTGGHNEMWEYEKGITRVASNVAGVYSVTQTTILEDWTGTTFEGAASWHFKIELLNIQESTVGFVDSLIARVNATAFPRDAVIPRDGISAGYGMTTSYSVPSGIYYQDGRTFNLAQGPIPWQFTGFPAGSQLVAVAAKAIYRHPSHFLREKEYKYRLVADQHLGFNYPIEEEEIGPCITHQPNTTVEILAERIPEFNFHVRPVQVFLSALPDPCSLP